ncbi:metal-dependent hydrolase [Allorhodopirellula heiligendammensis]|uniref:Inner membrane protein n=1 Tax=Allorhodopirellula heiligendammensis TaxID=2714739 RepID=A0A5C6C136_9BACT|nr:metal-dependent hydrolase [Allorhodopirellula heiligendammensis]TWU17878.1 hypothetical protein Poly21_00290 [Allorhodopirellula heiligendammensis]
MDIATHALIGTATAAGLFQTQPALAVGLVLGNVAPDLDALSRVAGKHAFLRFHQTYTHSAGAIATVLAVAVGLLMAGIPVWGELAIGLVVGMAMHVGLDLANSYGVKCLWPFSQKRFALDWIFFIDAFIVGLCFVTLVAQCLCQTDKNLLRWSSIIFVTALMLYVGLRSVIAGRAKRLVNSASNQRGPISIIPTTWSPFRFLVCRQQNGLADTFTLDARSGLETEGEVIAILDENVPETVTQCREWQVMRSLSAFFFCLEIDSNAEGETYTFRDLRIRNFRTKFGKLTCQLDNRGVIQRKTWDV